MLPSDLERHEVDGIGIGPALEPDPKRLGVGRAGNSPRLSLGNGREEDLRRQSERG
jgi:hypothetical protein